jgi:hypothetical protein
MRGQDGSIDEEFACAQTILTQTKRGQKHDIMPVGQRPPPRQIACSSAPAMPMRTGALAATPCR